MKNPKFYFIAGEDSGDLHGANLVKGLKALAPTISCQGFGGDLMENEGVRLSEHIRNTSFMGFWEVLKNIFTIQKLFTKVKADILSFQPDVLVLIDYPGFNLRMAKWASQQGIPVFYYISPQLWAWKKGRIREVRKFVDRMFVILPFEQLFYKKEGIEVSFCGHPLLDAVAQFKEKPILNIQTSKPIVALLPGSRTQEIKTVLPLMLKIAEKYPQYEFMIAGAPSRPRAFYAELIKDSSVQLVMNQTYALLSKAHAALVTSGTATLETALFGVPQVVCYKGSWLSYEIGRRLVEVKYISLPNLILDRAALTELIQYDYCEAKLQAEFEQLFLPKSRNKILADYQELQNILGEKGASLRVAQEMLERIGYNM